MNHKRDSRQYEGLLMQFMEYSTLHEIWLNLNNLNNKMAEPDNLEYFIPNSLQLQNSLFPISISIYYFNYTSSEDSLVVIWTTLNQNDSRQAHEHFSFGYFSVVFA